MGAKDTSEERGGFRLYCRGEVRLYSRDEDCTPKSKKGRALLAVLAAEQRPLSRTKIIDLLWSDRQEEQARASLRTLLADLKEQFNSRFEELLVVDRERVGLDTRVRTDLTDPTLARPSGELFEGLDHLDPELDEWLRVERERWRDRPSDRTPPAPPLRGPVFPRSTKGWSRGAALFALVALAIIAGAVALVATQPWKDDEPAIVAVLKFRDLSGRNELLAHGLAEQTRIELAQYPGVGVISAQSSEADEIKGKDARAVAATLGADYVLEGALVPHEGQVQLSLRLLERSSGKVSWSTVVGGSPTTALSGPRPVVPMIAEVLGDVARKTAPAETLQADAAAWTALFQARSLLEYYEPGPALQARELVMEVLSRYPKFVPALITLSHATLELADSPYNPGPLTRPQARAAAVRIARRALALAPDYGPAHSAMGGALDYTDAAAAYERRAVELNPGSGAHHHNWATELARIGDYENAIRHRRIAIRLNPLSWVSHLWLGEDLVLAGRYSEATDVLRDYLAKPIPRPRKLQLAANAELNWFGDWSRALVLAQAALREEPDDGWTEALNMWPALQLYGREAALKYSSDPDGLTTHILKDDVNGVIKAVRELDIELWIGGVDVLAAVQYLHSRGRGDVVLLYYDRALATGLSPESPELLLPELVVIMRANGRGADGDRLARRITRRNAADQAIAPRHRALRAAIDHALAGRNEAAVEALRIAHRNRWWASPPILDHPYNRFVFDNLRGVAGFQALVRDFDAWVERERAEAARDIKAAGFQPLGPAKPLRPA